jgi:hypothetical protein
MTPNAPPASVCDFARSFVRFRIDFAKGKPATVSHTTPTTLNNVRMPLECLATVTSGGRTRQFGLATSCKTERVFVDRDIWLNPNGDMTAIAGDNQFLVLTRYDRANKGVMLHPPSLGEKPDRQYADPAQALDSLSLDVRQRVATRIDDIAAILDALRSDREVVCRTDYRVEGTAVSIEYPVKTVNFSERHHYYQVDTGPVLYFGEPTGPNLIERLHPAFIAHLGGDWAEFIVSRPTPLENLPVSVHHYSDSRRVEAQNSLWLV